MTDDGHMNHDAFAIGETFWCSGHKWRCTDIGSRVITAIKLDHEDDPSWYNGPPYAVAEVVFDEYDIEGCTREPEPDDDTPSSSGPPAGADAIDEWDSAESNARQMAQAKSLRDQARAGGLRFETYLPSRLADWLLAHIESGNFRDPSEAAFVMLGEQQELEPHSDLRREFFKRRIQAGIDSGPGVPAEGIRAPAQVTCRTTSRTCRLAEEAMSTDLIVSPAPAYLPAQLYAPTPQAAKRVLEFFTAQVNNDHTRAAYLHATKRFAEWCGTHGLRELVDVEPIHVAAFVKDLQGRFAPPTVKQHLAAIRMLFDWLVTGHVIGVNPAHAVRGPKYVVKRGKTPVLTSDEARILLDSIDTSTLKGLRDRALIGVMVYTFARVNAVLQMKVKDYYTQGRRGWVRLHEKGGKEHEVPCHHTLEQYLDEYIAAADIAEQADGPLFRSTGRKTGLAGPLHQQDVYRMIQRQVLKAGLGTRAGCHTFRATGITAYLKNNGLLEHAQTIANHSSPRTTKLYDRRSDEISLDEVEKISI